MSPPATAHHPSRSGLVYGLLAYGLWGLAPVYFKSLGHVRPIEVLANRIVWSVAFLALLLTVLRRWPDLFRCLRSRPLMSLLIASSLLNGVNWFVYIYAVATDRIMQTSLGYYVTPLLSVLLGMVFFGERLRRGQWAALALAALGVLYLALDGGELPWIALCLALSFGVYGLVRKKAAVDSLTGLTVETSVLLPAAVAALAWWGCDGSLALGHVGPPSGAPRAHPALIPWRLGPPAASATAPGAVPWRVKPAAVAPAWVFSTRVGRRFPRQEGLRAPAGVSSEIRCAEW